MIDNWCHLSASPKIGMLLVGNRSLFYCEEHDDSLILLIVMNMMILSEFEKMCVFFVWQKNERKCAPRGAGDTRITKLLRTRLLADGRLLRWRIDACLYCMKFLIVYIFRRRSFFHVISL